MLSEPVVPAEKTAISSLSPSSILILSGFLVGTATGHAVRPEVEYLVLAAGLIGLIAYMVFALLSRQKQQQVAFEETQKALKRMQMRLDRHLSHDEVTGSEIDHDSERTWSLAEIQLEYSEVKRARRNRQLASDWDSTPV